MSKKDQIKLFPTSLNGSIKIPPSKSLSHRALICAALSKGKSKISNVLLSEDIKATMNALKHLGAKFDIKGDEIIVQGVKRLKYDNEDVYCNESGSTIRFMIPIFSLTKKEVTFTGKESLISRPQNIYQDIFKNAGNKFEVHTDKIVVNGSIKSNDYYIDGNVSSQFFSGLMFALPMLKEDSYLYYKGKMESKGYIDLTIEMLEHFGVKVQEIENGYYIKGNQQYQPNDYYVEGDYSQAAFFLVAGALNSYVQAHDLNHESNQGDQAIIDIIKEMEGKVIFTENGFIAESTDTHGSKIDISDCPDLGPIVALLGALSKGTTTIQNVSRLRIKESDRVKTTVETLNKLGGNLKATDNEIIIHGKKSLQGGIELDSYNDHRIAMMISIAALVCKDPIILNGANAVNKSYPNFFEDYRSLGGKYE